MNVHNKDKRELNTSKKIADPKDFVYLETCITLHTPNIIIMKRDNRTDVKHTIDEE